MSAIFRIWAVFIVTAKRILSNRGLVLAHMFGLVVSIALTMSIPLYTNSIYYRIFNEKLSLGDSITQEEKRRPAFAFMFRYIGSWSGPIEWEDVQPLDEYLSGPGQSALGLPNRLLVRHFTTDSFRLFPSGNLELYTLSEPLAWVKFSTFSDFEQHVDLVEGNFPEGIFLPSKLADYLVAGKPVLALSPARGVAADLSGRKGLTRVDIESGEGAEAAIASYYQAFRSGRIEELSPGEELKSLFAPSSVAELFRARVEEIVNRNRSMFRLDKRGSSYRINSIEIGT